MVAITLPDGSQRRFDGPVSGAALAAAIGPGLAKAALAVKVDTLGAEHFEIASDPVAAGYVLNALDPAHPRPVPCTVVLPFEGPVA